MPFPISPANNLIALVNGIEYVWNASKGAWYRYGDATANVITANTFQALNGVVFSDGTIQTTAPLSNTDLIILQGGLNTANANISLLYANIASINTILQTINNTANNASANTILLQGGLSAANANISLLYANVASINTLVQIANTTANNASANTILLQGGLNTANANISLLYANVASINTLVQKANTTANLALAGLNTANANISLLISYSNQANANIISLQIYSAAAYAYANGIALNSSVDNLARQIANTASNNIVSLQSYSDRANANISLLISYSNQANANIITLQANVASINTILQTANTTANLALAGLNTANANISLLISYSNQANANIISLQSYSNQANANVTLLQSYSNQANANIISLQVLANTKLGNTGALITVNGFSQLYISNTFAATSNITGALTIAGGLAVSGNVYGSKIFANTPTSTVYVNQSQLGQDLTNVNSHLYTLGMFSGNTDQSIQVGIQNFANTQNSSTDLAIYNNIGTDSNNYIDIGITSAGYNVALNNFTASKPGDGYLYANGSNLIIGTYTPGTNMKIFVGGYNAVNVVATFDSSGISGNVSATNITANSIGYLGTPQNIQAASYTLALSDSGKQIFLNQSANTINLTVPQNSSVPFPIGTIITVATNANTTYTSNIINSGSSTLYLIPTATSRTAIKISGYGAASLLKVATDTWYVTGVGVI